MGKRVQEIDSFPGWHAFHANMLAYNCIPNPNNNAPQPNRLIRRQHAFLNIWEPPQPLETPIWVLVARAKVPSILKTREKVEIQEGIEDSKIS